jgi:hypothetical protein
MRLPPRAALAPPEFTGVALSIVATVFEVPQLKPSLAFM